MEHTGQDDSFHFHCAAADVQWSTCVMVGQDMLLRHIESHWRFMQLSNVQPVLAEITRRSSRVALADYPSLLREGVLYNPGSGC